MLSRKFKQPDSSRSPAWAHPAVTNGKLYIWLIDPTAGLYPHTPGAYTN